MSLRLECINSSDIIAIDILGTSSVKLMYRNVEASVVKDSGRSMSCGHAFFEAARSDSRAMGAIEKHKWKSRQRFRCYFVNIGEGSSADSM
jgi:hypothetical protein